MSKLEKIVALPADALELLGAMGYQELADFGNANTDKLIAELNQANKLLGVMSEIPAKQILEEWQQLALAHQEASAEKDPAPAVASEGDAVEQEAQDLSEDEINLEQDSGILEMLAISPEARPLDPESMAQRKLLSDELPEGVLLNQCRGKIKINVMTSLRRANAHLRRRDEVKRIGLKASRIRSFEDLRKEQPSMSPSAKGVSDEEVARIESLNAGTHPKSRRFIKGVPHSKPASIRLAALSSVMMAVFLALGLVGVPVLLISQVYFGMENLILSALGLLAALLVSILFYLLFGLRAHCQVCSQRPFILKKCAKHQKAHHVWGVGYIVPTALHALFYKWFYCTYCGTAIRLKK